MNIQFLIFDQVEELDLVGPWELAGLLAQRKLCQSSPTLVTLNSMTPQGEHGMRFVADVHPTSAGPSDILVVPGGSGARVAMEDPEVIRFLREYAKASRSILSICTGSYRMQRPVFGETGGRPRIGPFSTI